MRPKTLWLLAMALVLTAWAQPYRVVDATGKEVVVSSTQRIVSLDGITTEILFALGVGN
jgi:iron complex transport system substrate-binding protein